MPSYTSSLRLIQPTTGEYPGTWGTQVNTGITALVDNAVAGTANIAVGSTDYTLSTANGATDEARSAVLNLTAGAGVGARNIICPALSKLYVVYNNTGFTQTIKTLAQVVGIVVPTGKTMTVRCDGTNVVEAITYISSDNVNFLPSGSGAVNRTVQAKLRDMVSILDYGAVVGSLSNQTTVIQAAIDAVNTAGGGTLLIPEGTFFVTGLAMKANVTLLGQSKQAILKMFSTSGVRDMITVTGQSNCTFQNLTIDLNNATGVALAGSIAIRHSGGVAANNLRIDNVSFVNSVGPNAFVDSYPSAISRGLFIENCEFNGWWGIRLLPNVAPSAPPSATACGNYIIRNNIFKNGIVFLQIRSGVRYDFDMIDSVIVEANELYGFLDDPLTPDSSTPIELWNITNLAVTGNTIYTGGRGMSCNYCKAASYVGNAVYDQTSYFLEMGASDDVVITGNTAYNCKTFVNDTGSNAALGSKNITISENVITGGNPGEVGFNDTVRGSAISIVDDTSFNYGPATLTASRTSNVATITTPTAHRFIAGQQVIVTLVFSPVDTSYNGTVIITSVPTTTTFTYANVGGDLGVKTTTASSSTVNITATSGYQNWRVADNVFVGMKNMDSTVYIQGQYTNGYIVESNYILQSDVTQQLSALYVENGSNIFVRNNIIRRTADITSGSINVGTYEPANTSRGIFIEVRPSTGSNVIVDNNFISFTGTDVRGRGSIALGHTQAAGALANSRFTNNRIAGAYSGAGGSECVRAAYTSGDFWYTQNDVSGVTSGTETLNAATVYRRTKREFEATASPTSGTYIVGDRVWNSAPAVGQPKSWVCTVAGTPGTWVSEGNL
jgi:hypothetical protein